MSLTGNNIIVKAAVSNTSYGYDILYSYRIPTYFEEKILKGMRVLVPFGNGNRKRVALILDIEENSSSIEKIKPIVSLIDDEPLINSEMIDMIYWLKETTICTYFEAFKTIIPSGLNINFTQKYTLTGKISYDLSEEEQALYNSLINSKNKKELDALLDTSLNNQKKILQS